MIISKQGMIDALRAFALKAEEPCWPTPQWPTLDELYTAVEAHASRFVLLGKRLAEGLCIVELEWTGTGDSLYHAYRDVARMLAELITTQVFLQYTACSDAVLVDIATGETRGRNYGEVFQLRVSGPQLRAILDRRGAKSAG